jgi:hypothetical protein
MCETILPLPYYVFMAWCSVLKNRDNFTFTLNIHYLTLPYLTKFGLLRVSEVSRDFEVKITEVTSGT